MKTFRVLYFAAELAPVTGAGDLARATASLTRALGACAIDLTVVVPRAPDRDPCRSGYARRLEPLRVSGSGGEATLFEGQLASAGGRVFLLDTEDHDLAFRAGLDLARARGLWPDLIQVGHGAETAARLIDDFDRGDLPRPAVVLDRDLEIPPGVDDTRWRATADAYARKPAAKLRLQRDWGLPPRSRTPLIAVIGPFDSAIASDADLAQMAALDAQIALLADPLADADRLHRLRDLASGHPTRVATREADGDATTRALLAAADLALLPRAPDARAPSGLHCAGFGAAPIAPRMGSYARVLVDFDEQTATGNGFLFDGRTESACVAAAGRGLRAFQHPAAFETLARRLVAMDLSWQTAALKHLDEYRKAIASS